MLTLEEKYKKAIKAIKEIKNLHSKWSCKWDEIVDEKCKAILKELNENTDGN